MRFTFLVAHRKINHLDAIAVRLQFQIEDSLNLVFQAILASLKQVDFGNILAFQRRVEPRTRDECVVEMLAALPLIVSSISAAIFFRVAGSA